MKADYHIDSEVEEIQHHSAGYANQSLKKEKESPMQMSNLTGS